jgi:hypothetical protein
MDHKGGVLRIRRVIARQIGEGDDDECVDIYRVHSYGIDSYQNAFQLEESDIINLCKNRSHCKI